MPFGNYVEIAKKLPVVCDSGRVYQKLPWIEEGWFCSKISQSRQYWDSSFTKACFLLDWEGAGRHLLELPWKSQLSVWRPISFKLCCFVALEPCGGYEEDRAGFPQHRHPWSWKSMQWPSFYLRKITYPTVCKDVSASITEVFAHCQEVLNAEIALFNNGSGWSVTKLRLRWALGQLTGTTMVWLAWHSVLLACGSMSFHLISATYDSENFELTCC